MNPNRKLEEAESARAQAREELRAAILEARDEGITLAAIGRAAGLSRQRIRQLVEPR
jgi:DNA-directed RNA polymerase sigma subunit (sigma70/sigma32)